MNRSLSSARSSEVCHEKVANNALKALFFKEVLLLPYADSLKIARGRLGKIEVSNGAC